LTSVRIRLIGYLSIDISPKQRHTSREVREVTSKDRTPRRAVVFFFFFFFFLLTTISLHFDLWLPGESSVWNEDGTIQFESPSLFDFQKIFFRAAPSPTKIISGGRRRAAQRRYFLKMVETSQDLASFDVIFFVSRAP